jgi:hypothetical protein
MNHCGRGFTRGSRCVSIAGIEPCAEIEPMTLEFLRVILPRFERRLCRRNLFWGGEVRKGGGAPLRAAAAAALAIETIQMAARR